MSRWPLALWILWTAAALAIFGYSRFKLHGQKPAPRPCTLQFQRDLPENYRLQATDVEVASDACKTDWQGKYLARSARSMDPVLASELRQQPVIEETPQHAAVLSDAPGTPLNAGWLVDIYRDGQLVAARVRVLAVICSEGKCSFAVLSIPTTDVKKFGESKGPSVYVLRSQG